MQKVYKGSHTVNRRRANLFHRRTYERMSPGSTRGDGPSERDGILLRYGPFGCYESPGVGETFSWHDEEIPPRVRTNLG